MNPMIQPKTTPPLFIALALLGFALLPRAQAVVPPPDGGYPNFTTAEGTKALQSLTTGPANTAVGWYSLFSNTEGSFNTATGAGALLFNTAHNNTAFGAAALLFNTTGGENTAVGTAALLNNTIGLSNTAIGDNALRNSTAGSANTAIGDNALRNSTAGSANTAIGVFALANNDTGNGNVAVGSAAGSNVTTADNVIAIGAPGLNVSNSCFIGSIAGQTVGAGGTTCYVDNDGKLGVFLSARRFKTDIADMGAVSEALLALRPITFHYKPDLDKKGIPQFGLVAEEVAEVNPDLVTRDAKGELSTVRYEAINAMLLNEFLKEHRKVEEQQATIAELKSNDGHQQQEIKALVATVNEQAAQIQKVSAEIAMGKATPNVVLSSP